MTAFEGSIQPHFDLSLIVDTELILIYRKEAHYSRKLSVSMYGGVVYVKHTGVGYILDVGNS